MRRFLLLFLLVGICTLEGSARKVYNIDKGWKFYTYDERDTIKVDLPHTWNITDALAGHAGYFRGAGNYLKYVHALPEWQGKRVFVRFYGAGNVTDLMVNGHHAGMHAGGNNAFEFEITNLLNYGGKNLLWVIVNNAPRFDVLPTAGKDNSYGGLYRSAEIIVTEQAAIGFNGYGGNGILIVPETVDSLHAAGIARIAVNIPETRSVQLGMTLRDNRDTVVWSGHLRHRADMGMSVAEMEFDLENPHLWNGISDPYLYTVTVTLNDGGRTDTVSFRTGFRKVSVDAATGFYLNDMRYPLRGVVLWRDQAVYGPTFNEAQLRRDIKIIREMGANAVRVAGGTHHPAFYDICDEEGLIVLADGPFIGAASLYERGYYNTDEFRHNGMLQMQELIHQHFNNPSVAFWGVFVEPELIGDDPLPFIREMNDMTKELDPTRLTAGMSNKDGEVNFITDLIVWNHTFGWNEGQPGDIAIWRDQLHGDPEWSKLRSAISYRAEGNIHRYAEQAIRRGDTEHGLYPENWQAYVHEVHIGALNYDPAFWAMFVGDIFDHGAVQHSTGGADGAGNCGLVTFDRSIRKDAYWLYKANWNKTEPFLRIASKRHSLRSQPIQDIVVYTNQSIAELYLNGSSLGTCMATNGVMRWENVELTPGENEIYVFTIIATNDNYVTVGDSATITYLPDGIL